MLAAMNHTSGIGAALAAAVFMACSGGAGPSASAELRALGRESGIRGTVSFSKQGGKVHVEAEVTGLPPGPHGFHIHAWGDCSAPDGTSAGDHFNPQGHEHGAPGPAAHPGDLGNLVADSSGKATLSLELDSLTVDTGALGIVGRAVIVHEKVDDLVSQPVGAAGARIACGVIMADDGTTKPVLAPVQ